MRRSRCSPSAVSRQGSKTARGAGVFVGASRARSAGGREFVGQRDPDEYGSNLVFRLALIAGRRGRLRLRECSAATLRLSPCG